MSTSCSERGRFIIYVVYQNPLFFRDIYSIMLWVYLYTIYFHMFVGCKKYFRKYKFESAYFITKHSHFSDLQITIHVIAPPCLLDHSQWCWVNWNLWVINRFFWESDFRRCKEKEGNVVSDVGDLPLHKLLSHTKFVVSPQSILEQLTSWTAKYINTRKCAKQLHLDFLIA